MTALVQAFLDPNITTGKAYLWAAFPVFSAKVMTLLRCRDLLLTKNLMRRIHICSGRREALAILAKTTAESSLVWECMQMLGKLTEFNNITLVWIPGHQQIPDNEEADTMAKEGAIKVPPNQLTTIPFKKLIKKQLELRHQARWTACTSCGQSKVLMRYALPSTAKLLAMSKLRLRAAVGLLTGHMSLRAHLNKHGHTKWQECRLCGHDKEGSVQMVCLSSVSL
jgi:hypothetical protein